MAQEGDLGDIAGAGEDHGHLSVLLGADGLNMGRGVLLQALAQAESDLLAHLKLPGLLGGDIGGEVPGVIGDDLAGALHGGAGAESVQPGGGHIRQKVRGEGLLAAVGGAAVDSGDSGFYRGGAGELILQRGNIAAGLGDGLVDLLQGLIAVAALEHGGFHGGHLLGGGGIVAVRRGYVQAENAVGNIAVHLQGGVAVQKGAAGKLKLLQLQLRVLQLAHHLQSALAGVGHGYGLAGVDLLPFLNLAQEGAGGVGQGRLLTDHPAGDGEAVGHLAGVGHRDGHGPVEIPIALYA